MVDGLEDIYVSNCVSGHSHLCNTEFYTNVVNGCKIAKRSHRLHLPSKLFQDVRLNVVGMSKQVSKRYDFHMCLIHLMTVAVSVTCLVHACFLCVNGSMLLR